MRYPTRLIPLILLFCLGALPATAAQAPDEITRQAFDKVQAGDNPGALALLERARAAGDASPQALAMLGALYVGAGRPDDAVAVLEPLARADDADPAVLFNLARAHLRAGAGDRAEQLLERSVAREPVSPAARLLGMRRGEQGRYREAYRLLRPWALTNPADREARLAAIYAALEINRAAEAEELIQDLPAENPDVALMRARLQLQLGDPYATIETIKSLGRSHPGIMDYEVRVLLAEALVLTRQPSLALEIMAGQPVEHAGVALLLGQARMQLGDAIGAARTLAPVVEPMLAGPPPEDPRLRGLHGALVIAYGSYQLAAGKHAEALRALERGTQLRPESPRPWLLMADALTAVGRGAEAKNARAHGEELRRSAGQPPSAGEGTALAASLRRAVELERAGQLDEALEMVRREQETRPGEATLLLLETRLLIRLGRPQEAEVASERALLFAPEMPDALYHRALVQTMKQDLDAAEKTFRQVLDRQAEHLPALNDLAALLLGQGRKDEARELLERVVALNPDDEAARQRLAAIGL